MKRPPGIQAVRYVDRIRFVCRAGHVTDTTARNMRRCKCGEKVRRCA